MTFTGRTIFPPILTAAAGASRSTNHHQHGHAVAGPADPQSSTPSAPTQDAHRGHTGQNGDLSGALGGDVGYTRYIGEMHSGMDRMMRDMHADPPSGSPDVDFLVMMIPHHWGATEMARLVLLHGRDPLVRELAEKILSTQVSEIDGMRGRLAVLRESKDDYPLLTGNRGSNQTSP